MAGFGRLTVDVFAVQRAMANKGMTGVELARVARCSSATITKIMRGGQCYASTIGKIAKALNVKGESLIKMGGNGAA